MKQAWPLVPLGEVLTRATETVTLRPDAEYREVTVKLWGKGVVERRRAMGTEIAAPERAVVRYNQFILSRIDARNGASGLVPAALDGAIVSSDFPTFNLNADRLTPGFLGWLSKTHDFVDLCKRASEGTTNRVRLKEERFLATEIPLPPLSEQRRIVARIEELAAKVEEARALRRQAAEEAEALSRSSLRSVFGGDVHESTRLESLCETIIDCLHSNPVYAEGGIPTLRSPDVGWGTLDLKGARTTSEEEYLRRTARGKPRPGDLILVREGGGTGKVGLTRPGQKFSLGQRVMLLRPRQSAIIPEFLLYQWLSPLVFDDQITPLSKGSASPHLNIGAIRTFAIRVPTLAVQRRIVAYLDGLRAKVDAVKKLQTGTTAELDALLPSILDKAFKGEL
jgi:type I restriction enzyme S subunit